MHLAIVFRYKKEHPDAHKEPESEFEEWFETDSQRELRQVFSVQSQMYEAVKSLGNKLDEVIGRQERTLSLLSTIPGGGVPVHGQIPDGRFSLVLFFSCSWVEISCDSKFILLVPSEQISMNICAFT